MHQSRSGLSLAEGIDEVLADIFVIFKRQHRRSRRVASVDLAAGGFVFRTADIPTCDVGEFEGGRARRPTIRGFHDQFSYVPPITNAKDTQSSRANRHGLNRVGRNSLQGSQSSARLPA